MNLLNEGYQISSIPSCYRKNGKIIIIDPGYLTFEKGFKVTDFQGVDFYLITHQHADHLGPETIKELVSSSPVYGNSDVIQKLKEVGVENTVEVKDKQNFTLAGFEITPIDIPHFQKPGVVMPPNTGFIIDGVFFHPGDGWKIDDLTVEKLAAPISGPRDGEIGFTQALELIKSVQAKVVIPIHYDAYPADANEFENLARPQGIEVRVLSPGQETEI